MKLTSSRDCTHHITTTGPSWTRQSCLNFITRSAPIISLLLDHPGPNNPVLTCHHEICTHHITTTGPSWTGQSCLNFITRSAPIISLLLDHPGPNNPVLTSSRDLHPSYHYYWTILDRAICDELQTRLICTHHITTTGPSWTGQSCLNFITRSAPIISLLLDHPGPNNPVLTSSRDLHPSYHYYWTILDRTILS